MSAGPAARRRNNALLVAAAQNVQDIVPTEHESQVAFFEWWDIWSRSMKLPTNLCFAVPNGGQRHPAVAAKLKAEGVRSGTADVVLLLPRAGFHGLLLEFKRENAPRSGSGGGTKPQAEFLLAARQQGYNALLVYSTDEAIRVVRAYVRQPATDDGGRPAAPGGSVAGADLSVAIVDIGRTGGAESGAM